jgi:hypothetical protein
LQKYFPLPLFTFVRLIRNNGGISVRKVKNLFPWLLKTTVLEPFRWIELATQNQKILNHVLPEDPIFVLGFYRSGTTYLQQLLLQDDRKGYHSVFQMVFPEIMLSSEKWLLPTMESMAKLFKMQDPVHRIPLSWQFLGEEDATMTASLNPMGAQWGYFFPSKMMEYFNKYVLFENLSESEKQDWSDSFQYLIKKISIANQGKQLVLKSPPQTARVKHLLSLFPRAKFIFIHRNPYEVFASNRRFWKISQDIYTIGSTKNVDVDSIILDTYCKTTDRYLLEKAAIPKGQLVELAYNDFINKPVENMRHIYESLQLNDFGYCLGKMTSFAAEQKNFVQLNQHIRWLACTKPLPHPF